MSVEELAAGLTKAQRICFIIGSEMGCCPKHTATGKGLVSRGLATPTYRDHYRMLDWSPTGLAVRSYLMAQDGALPAPPLSQE